MYLSRYNPVQEIESRQTDSSSDSQRKKWYVVFTKPKREASAEENLRRQAFECFLPRIQQPRRRQNKRVVVAEPMFPRYLFVHVDVVQQNVAPIRSTFGVSGLVRFGNELAVVPDPIIETLLIRADRENGVVSLKPPRFQAGDEVLLLEGSMAGIRGIFQATTGQERVVILLNLLGRENRVTLPESAIAHVA
jgi:transcriptional antiterminator RfaH